jgi:hypothetical protein
MRKLSETRQFHIGDILSVIAHKNLGPSGMEGVQTLLEYMTGEEIWTRDIGKAAAACAPALLKMHPFLASIDTSRVTDSNHLSWLHGIANKHGNSFFVSPLEEGEYAMEDQDEESYEHESGG